MYLVDIMKEFNKMISQYMSNLGQIGTHTVTCSNHTVTFRLKRVKDPKDSSTYCRYTFVVEVLEVVHTFPVRDLITRRYARDENNRIVYNTKTIRRPSRSNVNALNRGIRYKACEEAIKVGMYFSVDRWRIEIGEIIYPKD